LERGRRIKLGKNLLNLKQKAADNQFNLTMFFQTGDTRSDATEIKGEVKD
jgi:predicted amino acid-binding ACT domain protein